MIIPALAFAKASVAQLVISIAPKRLLTQWCYASLGFTAAWAIASIFAMAFQCNLPSPWETEGKKCIDLFGLNIGIYSSNIATDLLVIVISFMILQQAQFPPKRRWILRGLFASRVRYGELLP